MYRVLVTLAALSLATPGFADNHATGDAAKGAKTFNKCKSCHMIVSDTDEVIQKGGKTGPNLWGIYQRVPGSVEDYKYGKDMVAAGELVPDGWDEETFVAYVADPKKWLQTTLESNKVRSKMSFKLKKANDAKDVWAYLLSVGPEPVAATE